MEMKIKDLAVDALNKMGPLLMNKRINCDAISIITDEGNKHIMMISVYNLDDELNHIMTQLPNTDFNKANKEGTYYLELGKEYKKENYLYREMSSQPIGEISIKVKLEEVSMDNAGKGIDNKDEQEGTNSNFLTSNLRIGGDDISLCSINQGYGTLGCLLYDCNKQLYALTCYHNFRSGGITGQQGDIAVSPSKDRVNNHPNREIGTIFWYQYKPGLNDIALVKITQPERMGVGLKCDRKIAGDFFKGNIKEGDEVKHCGNTFQYAFRKGKIESDSSFKRLKENDTEFVAKTYVTNMVSKKGDSGGVVLNKSNEVIGLLYSRHYTGTKYRSFFYDLLAIEEIRETNGSIKFKFGKYI
ncbi:MAG: trypsin-like peptidase domain-containing protein [Bacteroidota bacterium]